MRNRNIDDGSTVKLTALAEGVEKGLRRDSTVVMKAEPTLAELCIAIEEQMILDEVDAINKAEARSRVWRSALGKAWVGMGRGPLAHLPYKEAIAKTDAMCGGWANELLQVFDGVEKGWTK